jgi:hypothetical protein
MTIVIAAMSLVGILAALNLILTLGVIRRLREHTGQLNRLSPAEQGPLILSPGERPAEFRATTIDGREVTRAGLPSPALVGFFSPDCGPCKEWLPRFTEAAAASTGRTLAVVVAMSGAADAEVDAEVAGLRGVADVVVEEPDGPVQQAFLVRGWPAMCRLSETGTVLTSDNDEVVALPVGR